MNTSDPVTQQPPLENHHRIEVFYDGLCPLCVREMKFIRRCDIKKRIQFTDIASPQFDARPYGLTHDALMDRIHARLPDGKIIEGVEVFRRLYDLIGLSPLVRMSRLPGVSHVLDMAYNKFAKNRLRLTGRCQNGTCDVRSAKQTKLGAIVTFLVAMSAAEVSIASSIVTENRVSFYNAVSIRTDQGLATLPLVGTGTYAYMGLFDLISAAYYTTDARPSATNFSPRRLEIYYHRPISAHDFARATKALIQSNVSEQTYRALLPKIEQICRAYRDVNPGDRYAVVFLPHQGLTLTLNGKSLVRIAGGDFADAYFSIWLGKSAMDDSLRRALLACHKTKTAC